MFTKHTMNLLGCQNVETGRFLLLHHSITYFPFLTLPSAYSHWQSQIVWPRTAVLISETYIYCHKTETRKHNQSRIYIYLYFHIYIFSSTKHPDLESGPFLQYNTMFLINSQTKAVQYSFHGKWNTRIWCTVVDLWLWFWEIRHKNDTSRGISPH